MKINLKTSKINLTPELKDYVQKKIDMLEKYLGKIEVINCDVELSLSVGSQNHGKIYRAECNLKIPHKLLRIEKTEKNLNKAIDKVKDHLVQMIVKHKEKLIDKNRKIEKF